MARARPASTVLSFRVVSSMPLSENRGSLSAATPYRDPYCKSLLQRWFKSLPAGQSLEVSLSSLVSLSVLSLPGLPQLGPCTLAAVSPFHHKTVLPNPEKGRLPVYSVFRLPVYSAVHSKAMFTSNHVHTEMNHLSDRSHPSVAISLTVSFSWSGHLS